MNNTATGPFQSEKEIVLASGSPRRKELLQGLGLDLTIQPSTLDEPLPEDDESPQEYALRMAEMKTRDVANQHPDATVIGADTIVVLNDRIMGKPHNEEDALNMLKALAGEKHQVITAFCIILDNSKAVTQAVVTDVYMRESSDKELLGYIATGEPVDKAGAYAIQGIGTFLVKDIKGSYTNVVGLPLTEVIETLVQWRVIAAR
ncbi:conserved protein of unknown function [Pseudodesulfovibrio profundus]|uniref:dTTP/UTP pyrophosphatase n=1 Tax=Pseudodesulfovibrio profundus TaxID=57320 RepID=A0A2C8F3H8_9BACT|nr:Maf family protein [Pseudodesulfovibrio profundus]SOB57143.1 conserved protein of unknown function [Pseudodesulfovibrio profundus]